jgi:hypothetical protein
MNMPERSVAFIAATSLSASWRMKLLCLPLFFGLIEMAPATGRSCDLCGCYTPQMEAMPQMDTTVAISGKTGWYAAMGEQFTRFGTVQIDGREVANPTGQYENSSIIQLVAGYSINTRFALQLGIPVIDREFKRPEGFSINRGTEAGLGDISLLLKSVFLHYSSPAQRSFEGTGKSVLAVEQESAFTASIVLLTGIKFPTGDSDRLKEESHELDIPGAPQSGIHGHDLTLGTGSYDGIMGGQSSVRYQSVFLESNLQFALRGDGAHQYHFANELTWSTGPGYYFWRSRDAIFGMQLVVSGEHKDVDRFRGAKAVDTGTNSIFLGPRLVASRGRFSAEIAAEFPVSIDNTALQVVPDYRLRAGVSLHF